VRYEDQHIDKEGKQAHKKVDENKNEDAEKITSGVRGRMKVGSSGHDKAGKGQKGCNRMHYENSG